MSSSPSSTSSSSSASTVAVRYEIQRTAQYIYKGKYRRVALQFPDELLHDSPSVITSLRKELLSLYNESLPSSSSSSSPFSPSPVDSVSSSSSSSSSVSFVPYTFVTLPVQLFILGDTSYGSCCVDEVAAAHGNADCIIHYGYACLSSPSSLPVLYIFGQQEINDEQSLRITRTLVQEIRTIHNNQSLLSSPSSSDLLPYDRIVFLWDPELTYCIPSVLEQIVQELEIPHSSITTPLNIDTTVTVRNKEELTKPSNVSITFRSPVSTLYLPTLARSYHSFPSSFSSSSIPTATVPTSTDRSLLSCCGFTLPSSSISPSLSSDVSPSSFISRTCILYWGNKETRCRLFVSQYPSAGKLLHVLSSSPSSSSAVSVVEDIGHQSSRIMAKRYRMIEAIRAANIIGIVCGTLAVEGHQKLLETLTKIIKGSDKNLYIFLLGKLNPAKLANFPEIDIFILVACPESTFFDSTAYSKPIATPHEVIVALADYTSTDIVESISSQSKEWQGYSIVNFKDLLPSSSSSLANGTNGCCTNDSTDTVCRCRDTDNDCKQEEEEDTEGIPVYSLLSSSTNPNSATAVLRKRNKRGCAIHGSSSSTNSHDRVSNIDPQLFSTTLVTTDPKQSTTVINYSQYGKAAEYYHTKRQWKGLSYDIEPTVEESLEQQFRTMNISSVVRSDDTTTTTTVVSSAIVTVPDSSSTTTVRPVYNTTIHTGTHGIASSYTYEGKESNE